MLQILPNYDTQPLSSGDQSNPEVLVADGNNEEAIVKRLFLHNTEAEKFYTRLTLQAANLPVGFTIKLLAQKNKPTEAEWAAVNSGNIATLQDLGSAAKPDLDYHPFWVYYKVSKGTPVQTQLGAYLQVTYIEHLRS